MKHLLVIIDGNAILHRAWHAMPPLATKDGRIISAAYGFTTMLMKMLKDLKPTHLAVTFDLPGDTFRHEAFAEYKAQRVKQPQELYDQIPMVKDVLKAFHFPVYELAGFEADDVIGTLSKMAPPDCETIIVTGDNDTLQLVDAKTKVLTLRKGMSDVVIYDEAAVKVRYGLVPAQLIDYKAMRGDPSDNLPGLKGIGEKGASELLQKYGDIAAIYIAVKKSPNDFKPRVLEALRRGEQDVPLSKQLVTIMRDLPLSFKLDDAKMQAPDLDRLRAVFQDLEFKTLLPKVERELGQKQASGTDVVAPAAPTATKGKRVKSNGAEIMNDAEAFATRFSSSKRFAFRFAYATDNRIAPQFSAVACTDKKGSAALVLNGSTLPKPLAQLFASPVAKIGHDVKDDLLALAASELKVGGTLDDVMLMSYLLSPGSRAHTLANLAFELSGASLSTQESLFPEERALAAAKETEVIFKVVTQLETKLGEEQLATLYRDVERPLVPVLAVMERNGIKVDDVFLSKMSGTMHARLATLTKAITEAAGEEFNINSPAQLQRILFEVLKLPVKGIRKTSTGQLSTGADELEKLRGAHPIVAHLFEHREYSKLLSTYVSAIPALIHPKTGRLHTHFNQAVAATGRLSSSDPNLQNIPIRTELGREIRKAFVAPKGRLLIAADYSQIELHIAAHIANDEAMLEAFRAGADIHTSTAARIWNVKPENVSYEQRRAAKAINFGILYGMGQNALAASTGVSTAEAKDFIKRYLTVYSGIRTYMEEAKAQAKSLGYVETLFGRRRYLPEINSGVPFVRAEAERMAVNMPIQGTNADIIKMAMVTLHARITETYGIGSEAKLKMLLQVHDELIFEADAGIAKEVSVWIKETMESAATLKTPIVVDVEIGPNWGAMK